MKCSAAESLGKKPIGYNLTNQTTYIGKLLRIPILQNSYEFPLNQIGTFSLIWAYGLVTEMVQCKHHSFYVKVSLHVVISHELLLFGGDERTNGACKCQLSILLLDVVLSKF